MVTFKEKKLVRIQKKNLLHLRTKLNFVWVVRKLIGLKAVAKAD